MEPSRDTNGEDHGRWGSREFLFWERRRDVPLQRAETLEGSDGEGHKGCIVGCLRGE